MTNERDPWSKFYWADWLADPGLRSCTLPARGLWMDLLAIMHKAEPVGHLLINGIAPTAAKLAAMTGAAEPMVKRLLRELIDAGVPSTTEKGVLFNRRMVRDAMRRAVNRENGARGGNPNLGDKPPHKPKPQNGITDPDNQPDKPSDKPHDGRDPEARSHIGSDNKLSGGEPPSDPIKAVFDFGVKIITSAGASEKQARSAIGMWRKDIGDDAKLMALLISAHNQSAVEPISYVNAAIKKDFDRAKFGGGYVPQHPGAGG